jgi:hypothetical protein
MPVEEPALGAYRLVAATLPGHCGTQPPADFSTEHDARLAGELARARARRRRRRLQHGRGGSR